MECLVRVLKKRSCQIIYLSEIKNLYAILLEVILRLMAIYRLEGAIEV
jgi:hypothetical protein